MSSTGKQGDTKGVRRLDPIMLDDAGLDDLVAELRSPERVYAVVGVAWSLDGGGPVLAASEIRRVVEPAARVYLIPSDELLRELRSRLRPKLALTPGAIRIWWPGVKQRSDPGDHPLVVPLEGERPEDVLAEFARQFHLSRPDVRREIQQIEDARALAEHRLKEAEAKDRATAQRLRDAHVERNREAARAEAAGSAEAALKTVRRQLQAACGLGGAGRQLGLQVLGDDAAEKTSILRAFGENVAGLRAAAGLNHVELAARCFIRADAVSELERGERVPSLLVLQVLAQALNVSIGDLTAGLPPLSREAGRERLRHVIAKAPRSQRGTQHLAEASGLPWFYVHQLLHYMTTHGELINASDGFQLATEHPDAQRADRPG
jgi:transcriptional regulator with XRE-family HTH domain